MFVVTLQSHVGASESHTLKHAVRRSDEVASLRVGRSDGLDGPKTWPTNFLWLSNFGLVGGPDTKIKKYLYGGFF